MAVYGIDLGTTYSCVARIDDVGRPTVLRNLEGTDTTPSVVYFESADSVVVGQSAKDAAVLDPERVVQLIKRDMGDVVPREFHGRSYTPEEISARILRKLVDDAKAAGGDEARDVVISVPAYFGLAERDATRKAGEIAGLRVLDVVAEPIAAALDYGALDGDDEERQDRAVLVYDLGGGTFDTTVLTLRGRELTVLCTDGAKELGGSDFDDRVVMHLAERFRESHPDADDPLSDPQSETQLRKDAEEAKKALSFRERYTVPRHAPGPGRTGRADPGADRGTDPRPARPHPRHHAPHRRTRRGAGRVFLRRRPARRRRHQDARRRRRPARPVRLRAPAAQPRPRGRPRCRALRPRPGRVHRGRR
jgi:molecular chaperone DnaK (HSP70)